MRAIIFDLDGTLLNTLDDLAGSTNFALCAHGFPERTVDEVRNFVGNGIWKLIERAVPEGSTEKEKERVFHDFRQHYLEHCQDKTEPYTGILPVLRQLKECGYALAIVSNKADAAVKKLAKDYFGDLIPVAIGEREGIRKKPAPDSVFEALKNLGSKGSEAVYVGDSDVDIMTAENAGLPCISVTWGFREEELLTSLKPARIIHAPEELLGAVQAVEKGRE